MAAEQVKNFNFALHPDIAEEFRRIGDVYGEGNKLRWAIASAAVLRLLEMPHDDMEALIREVAGARHFPMQMKALVDEAKRKAGGGRGDSRMRMAAKKQPPPGPKER